jgi:regulator of protease activity HflC (stomatin/prohibitin superfamily)
MDYFLPILVIILLLALIAAILFRRVTIFEYQRGLLYDRGRFKTLLGPGSHILFCPYSTVKVIDTRLLNATIPGQEVLSADNVGMKLSLAASFQVADPYKAVNKVVNYQESLYLQLQTNLRDIVGSLPIDDILEKRQEISRQLFEMSASKAAEMGLELLSVNIKDIMFPGELKNIFAQVVNARKEGLAALEKARGESAALRNLANAAGLLEKNPNLMQLRMIQALEKGSGNTVVILPQDGNGLLKKG